MFRENFIQKLCVCVYVWFIACNWFQWNTVSVFPSSPQWSRKPLQKHLFPQIFSFKWDDKSAVSLRETSTLTPRRLGLDVSSRLDLTPGLYSWRGGGDGVDRWSEGLIYEERWLLNPNPSPTLKNLFICCSQKLWSQHRVLYDSGVPAPPASAGSQQGRLI